MTARIEIQIGKVRSIGLNIIKERVKKHYVMGIITAHKSPGVSIALHATEPEVLPGVWKLSPYAEETARGIKLIGIQAELLPQDLEGVDGAVGRWRFKLMVNKSGVGFFEVEAIAIVSDGYIATAEELMKILDQELVVREILLVTRVAWEGLDRYLASPLPTIREA